MGPHSFAIYTSGSVSQISCSYRAKIVDKDCLAYVFFLVISFNNLLVSLWVLTFCFCFTVAVVASWAACMGKHVCSQATYLHGICLFDLSPRSSPMSPFQIFDARIVFTTLAASSK